MGCDNGSHDGQQEEGDVEHRSLALDHGEQEVFGLRIPQYESALPEVVEVKSDKDEIPCPNNRFFAKMAHVGVQRLSAGGAEDHLRKHDVTRKTVLSEKLHCVPGVDCRHYVGGAGDGNQSRYEQCSKIDNHDRAEDAGHLVSSAGLDEKQGKSDQGGDDNQHRLFGGGQSGNQQQTFNRRKNRDGRGDNAISQQQRNPQEGKETGKGKHAPFLEELDDNLSKDDLTPLSLSAKAHCEPGVLSSYQDGHRPEDK